MINFRPSSQFDKDATLILLDKKSVGRKGANISNSALRKSVQEVLQAKQFSGEKGELFPLTVNKKLVLLAGVERKDDTHFTALRIAVRRALQSPYLKRAKTVEVLPSESGDKAICALIEAVLIGTYRWKKYISKSKDEPDTDLKQVTLVAARKKIFDDAIKICEGVNLTRDLINDNADTVTSDYIEKTVRALIKGKKNVTVEILNRKELKTKGLNLHLAVNQGSNKEPKLLIVKYLGASQKGNYTALIGKGMTFDTGGLNLKPSGSIENMRLDMSGAAAVVGTLKNVLSLGIKKNIFFVCGLAENAVGSGAYKPGDVIKSYSGKYVEVGNTDAEGRLVLADAISYVVKNYKPARIIDIATLTGACIVALGHDYTGLVTPDDDFSRDLVHASNDTDDRVWRLPIYPELKEAVKSKISDIRNLGFPKGAGGTITAAEFLRQFTEGTLWAHLDIAGTSFVDNAERWYYGHGATGAGVRLLTNYLQNH